MTEVSSTPSEPGATAGTGIDTTVSHSARIWDYWLSGKDNYQVDREVGDRIEEMLPDIVRQAREDRLFLGRVVRYLAGEAGVRQFLDIGTGLPTADNTHQVAQAVAPESKIVYVDNDPLVLAHARALLTSMPEGVTDYIHADMHDPAAIIAGAAQTLDFGQPIAITMLGVLWHVLDNDEAYAIVSHLMETMPSGSYLALNHPTLEVTGEKMATAIQYWNQYGKPPGTHRTPAELARFFDGMDLVEPGVVSITRWRPEATSSGEPEEIDQFGAVGRKPWRAKDNYAVDREAGDQYKEVFPAIAVVARTSRAFISRAVRYLAAEAGMRQFLDVGTGLPTANNTHQVAQAVAPESKIVYADNDPLVLAHARALLTSSPEGACEYLDADIRNPAAILEAAAALLDFKQPVALMLMGIMGHFTDDEAYPIVSYCGVGRKP